MILHGRRVLYEILFGLFLARLLGVGLDGGVFCYRHPGTSAWRLFVVRFQMLFFLFMSGYDLLRMFFFFPAILGDDFLLRFSGTSLCSPEIVGVLARRALVTLLVCGFKKAMSLTLTRGGNTRVLSIPISISDL